MSISDFSGEQKQQAPTFPRQETIRGMESERQPGWLSGLVPPSVQGMILETRDQVPRRAPCVEPASPSACVSLPLSLCLS